MDERVAAIAAGSAPEQVWLLEHPPLYTAGTSARPGDLIEARFPVHQTGRGGQFTYHGPGQRVAYVMLDLNRRKPDVRAFVATLEEWIIRTLAAFNVRGERREDRIGVWVRRPDKGEGFEDKIAALGIRVRKWVTLARHRHQRRAGAVAFLRDRAVRRVGAALRRDQPRRSRPAGDDGRGRHGAAARVRGAVRTDRALDRRQHREGFAAAKLQLVGRRLALVDALHTRMRRALAAGLDDGIDRRRVAGQHRLDGADAAVAHPAFEAWRAAASSTKARKPTP